MGFSKEKGSLGLASTDSWMTGEVFVSVMRYFIKHSGSTKYKPTVLIYDNHQSRLTIETQNLAKENGVIIDTFCPLLAVTNCSLWMSMFINHLRHISKCSC